MDSHMISMVVRSVVAVFLVFFGAMYARRLRQNPHTAKGHEHVQRQPRLLLLAVVGFALMGVVFGLVAATQDDITPANRIAFPIVAGLSIVAAAGMVLFYVNWGLVVGIDQIWMRTMWGGVKTIRYDQIVDYRFDETNGHHVLRITASDGTKMHLSVSHFQLNPLLQYLSIMESERKRRSGKWR